MDETTYPRLPLSEVPGYTPDGPVWVEWTDATAWASLWWGETDNDGALVVADTEIPHNPRRDDCALCLDATGLASLARAVAARVGLDVSGGVVVGGGFGNLTLADDDVDTYWLPGAGRQPAVPALRDATDTASALAIVARAVLT